RDTVAARAAIAEARNTFERLGDPVGTAVALSAAGDLALQRSTPLAAESLYRQGLDRLGTAVVPEARRHLRAGLANALQTRGALDAAAEELRKAIAEVESVAVELRSDERRTGFLADKWDLYASLARIERE